MGGGHQEAETKRIDRMTADVSEERHIFHRSVNNLDGRRGGRLATETDSAAEGLR
jgi:hypothetical protein